MKKRMLVRFTAAVAVGLACLAAVTAGSTAAVALDQPGIATVHGATQETVDRPTHRIGEAVRFTVTAKVPLYADSDKVQLIVDDELGKGFTYDPEKLAPSVTVGGETVRPVAEDSTSGYSFSAVTVSEGHETDVTGVRTEGAKLAFDLSAYLNAKIDAHDFTLVNEPIKVEFSAVFNGSAEVGAEGNQSAADVEYTDNLADDCDHVRMPATPLRVYTGGVEIAKRSQVDGKPLKGAEFSVYKADDTKFRYPLKFVSVSTGTGDEPNVYRTAENGEPGAEVALRVSDGSARLHVNGLDDAKYVFRETKTPDGYLAPSGFSFDVEISHAPDAGHADDLAHASQVTVSVDKHEHGGLGLVSQGGDGEIVVTNIRSLAELPASGAAGIILRLVIGLIVIAAAAAIYFIVRHFQRSRKAEDGAGIRAGLEGRK